MTDPKDPSLIPPGRYCYLRVVLAHGEEVPAAGPEWGRLQRVCSSQTQGTKEVLCPYVERTGYGTVRCLYLGREAIQFGQDRDVLAPALMARFGSPDAFDWFEDDCLLGDLIKVCRHGGMTEEDPDDPASASNQEPAQVWPHFAHLDNLGPGERVEHPRFGEGRVTDVDYTDNHPRVAVRFEAHGEKWLALNVALLRRVVSEPVQQEARLPWTWSTGLQGPFAVHGAPQRKPVGASVQAVAPPFKALRSVLYGALMPGFTAPEVWQSLWSVALPVREPLSAERWPQGAAVRWLDITQGRVPALEREGSRHLLMLCHQRWRDHIQGLRLRALENGRFWPAPRTVQVLLAEGHQIGLRLRFDKSYQPPYMPWLEHWLMR
jgi:hypothetical protein